MGLVACEDSSDLGVAQVNPQLPVFSANGLTVSGAPSSVNLDATVNQQIQVISIDAMENLPENATVSFKMQLALDESFTDPVEMEVIDGKVSSDEWESFVLSNCGKSPLVVTNYIRFAAFVHDGGQLSRLGGENQWYLPTSVTVTPVDLKLDVENAYYLTSASGTVELSHSDAHVYDDANFSLVFDVDADQLPYEWMIAPVSAVDNADSSNCYGVAETGSADDLSGKLVLGGQKGVINEAGSYSLTVNMLDKTYSITKKVAPQVDYLYTPGAANGWAFDDTNMLLFNNGDQTFRGYVYVVLEFKLSADTGWALNWGLDGGVMKQGGPNIGVDSDGLYYVKADFNDMSLGLTEITRIGVIGDFNSWGYDIALTPNEDYSIWSGEVEMTTDGGWKFRMNDGWDLDLGGSYDDLTQGGANMDQAAGVYTVTLDLSKLPYSCTVESK